MLFSFKYTTFETHFLATLLILRVGIPTSYYTVICQPEKRNHGARHKPPQQALVKPDIAYFSAAVNAAEK